MKYFKEVLYIFYKIYSLYKISTGGRGTTYVIVMRFGNEMSTRETRLDTLRSRREMTATLIL